MVRRAKSVCLQRSTAHEPSAGLGPLKRQLRCFLVAAVVQKFGFPAWFPTVLGFFKLTQAFLNWSPGGIAYAQAMFAFQLGGASFTHAIVEKPSKGAMGQVPVVAFFAISTAIQVLSGMPLPEALLRGAALFGFGFFTGYGVLALGSGHSAAAPRP